MAGPRPVGRRRPSSTARDRSRSSGARAPSRPSGSRKRCGCGTIPGGTTPGGRDASATRRGEPGMTTTHAAQLGWARLADVDPELWRAMLQERDRQRDKIELIASENYTFAAVMEAQGSWLTNKYAEGLPGKRYYGGCEFVDIAETLAQERALALFPGADHVNVQPHSGAQANMAAYFSVLQPGDPILGMKLDQGGHLTHGMKLNFSGRLYEVHAYGVRQDTERIDYDALEVQARD